MLTNYPIPSTTEPCAGCEGSGKRDGFTCMRCEGAGTNYAGFHADWELVVAALHYSGKFVAFTAASVSAKAYTLADGYGDFADDPDGLKGINDGWDWSHIRDSSAPAVRRMADYLRAVLPSHLVPARVVTDPDGTTRSITADSSKGRAKVREKWMITDPETGIERVVEIER